MLIGVEVGVGILIGSTYALVDPRAKAPLVTSVLWFRQDLRLADHPALSAAIAAGDVVPVYILDDAAPGPHAIGGAQRWWLHHSLVALDKTLCSIGSRLILRRGDSVVELDRLVTEVDATHIHATRAYEPWWQKLDAALGDRLMLHDGNHLAPPRSIRTGGGGRYKIFTPYWRALQALMPPSAPLSAPETMPFPGKGRSPASEDLTTWQLLPTHPDWATGFDVWQPGEAGAQANLDTFLAAVEAYETGRNLPSKAGTSRLSPHLHFGEVSPATVWHRIVERVGDGGEPYLREIGWRDYAANTIDQFPDYATAHARSDHDKLRTREGAQAEADFTAWTRGKTGYPIVDAGMRELWTTGWMHNRVRMIAASFLVKHLLIDWRRGERWFWDTLVDADYASNAVNWQWIAGSGVDSNMFVRIMAPLSQSSKFDSGDYIRRWVPELAQLGDVDVHDPHGTGTAPKAYAAPLIGHREGRERALAAYRSK